MRVLLVEDNEINMKLLVAYMRKLKLNHATAINGLEALNTYKEANGAFDVIFMGLSSFILSRTILPSLSCIADALIDISMPVMSGIESTRHIRRFERENSLEPSALIALTGAANPNTRQEAFSSGVDLFLTKPVPMKSLKIMLDELKLNGRESLSKDYKQ
jgi:CheY-like chemotaxis protein